ncbi:hypothetical protein [Rhizorhabdus argentea]|uniref:hypothetical protein n=1 Tax=Rhizorhabdus argentea TaxID=1387174 RepID=UPI0030ED4710
MIDRVILEHRSRDSTKPVLCGLAGTEPILVELDTSATMKLCPLGSSADTQKVIDQGYDQIVRAVQRLLDARCSEGRRVDHRTHIIVSALDLDLE